jgi:signal transduction histidine kinase
MLEPETRGKVRIELDCGPLPSLTVRPQQISAVFSILLHNAAAGAGDKGRVTVAARQHDSRVEVVVKDEGPGFSPAELAFFFEPSFKVTGSRVTGNWGLFSSRQVVREHGGDIHVRSTPGQGTEVTVTLPTETKLS